MRVFALATIAATLLAPLCASALVALKKQTFRTSAICLLQLSWVDSSQDISPCYLAAVVEGLCAGVDSGESGPASVGQDLPPGILGYLVPGLNANVHYTPPNSTTANLCTW